MIPIEFPQEIEALLDVQPDPAFNGLTAPSVEVVWEVLPWTTPIAFPLDVDVLVDVQPDPVFNELTGMLFEGELPSRTPAVDVELVCGGWEGSTV